MEPSRVVVASVNIRCGVCGFPVHVVQEGHVPTLADLNDAAAAHHCGTSGA